MLVCLSKNTKKEETTGDETHLKQEWVYYKRYSEKTTHFKHPLGNAIKVEKKLTLDSLNFIGLESEFPIFKDSLYNQKGIYAP